MTEAREKMLQLYEGSKKQPTIVAEKYIDAPIQRGKEVVTRLGRQMYEKIITHPVPKVREKYGKVAEALYKEMKTRKEVVNSTGDDSDLYSTFMATFIDQAFEPQLVASNVINTVNLGLNGYDSIKIPKDSRLSAIQISDDGTFASEADSGFDSVTATAAWYGAYTLIPQQLVEKSAVDLLAHRFGQLGRALARKVDEDIFAELEKATTAGDGDYGDNDNYVEGDPTFDNVIEAIKTSVGLYARPTDIVMDEGFWAKLHKTSDMKSALAYGTTSDGQIALVSVFGNLRIHVSPLVETDTAYVIDRNRLGYFVDAVPMMTFDGRVDKTIQNEVMAVKAWDVVISQPEAVVAIRPASAS